jgi:hypothetical protein
MEPWSERYWYVVAFGTVPAIFTVIWLVQVVVYALW